MIITPFATEKADAAVSVSASASGFKSDWQLYKYSGTNAGKLVYGYNTWAVNEDYAIATHSKNRHQAQIRNGNGYHSAWTVDAGQTSRIDVVHSGSTVSYYNLYY